MGLGISATTNRHDDQDNEHPTKHVANLVELVTYLVALIVRHLSLLVAARAIKGLTLNVSFGRSDTFAR